MRRLFAIAIAFTLAVSAAAPAAQQYPSRLIKFVSSAPPGATPDVVGRLFAQQLAEEMKQPVIVENRAGANGTLAVEAVSKAAADGYTFLVTSAATLSTNPFLCPETGVRSVTGIPGQIAASSSFLLPGPRVIQVTSRSNSSNTVATPASTH
jgi:tripartite-type tricarboxylate transporter receptor subunit TctC